MDVVSEVLQVSNFRGALGARIEARRDWVASLVEYPGMAMHAVLAGDAWVTTTEDPPLHLLAGDVVLMPAHVVHSVTDMLEKGQPQKAVVLGAEGAGQTLNVGSGPTRTRILTIFFDCDHATRTQVVDEMSGFMHVVGGKGGAAYLDDIVRFLGRELSRSQLATNAVIDNLIGIVLIQLIRAWIALRPAHLQGTWLGWAGDPVVREAIALIHGAPASGWTTSTLARAVSISRATLSRKFVTAMGLTPSDYVAQWRMDLAAIRLRDTSDSVETIAAAVGYQSVPSFTRAFARDRGRTPGAYRSHAHARKRRTVAALETTRQAI